MLAAFNLPETPLRSGWFVLDLGLVFTLYGSIVAVMNPFTALNNYLTLTETMDLRASLRVLRTAIVVVVILGFTFILAGKAILEFYHLSLPALQFGGGVLLMYIAVDMLSGQPKARSVEPGEVAVVPLATPMIVGPGTMTLLIYLATAAPLFEVSVAFLLSTATVAAALRGAHAARRLLGRSGIRAMARFMALIIASVAAQMMWSAVEGWSQQLLTAS